METRPFRITVMGAGAMGKLVAVGLVRAGRDVTLLTRRPEQAHLLQENGIHVIEADGTQNLIFLPATADASQLTSDLVILTVKSFDTESAARQIANLNGTPFVLSLQNGLGNAETLASVLNTERILLGVSTYGATSLSDTEVAIRGQGEWVIGGLGKDHPFAEQVTAIFSEAGWNVRVSGDMQKEVWLKALVNIGINPLTAIHGVVNGEIRKRQELRSLAAEAVKEAGVVSQRLGILTSREVEQSIERMLEICGLTAANRSSMLQDIERHRRTEIDSLNGAIVRFGESLGIKTPVNRMLTQQIRQLQHL